MRRARNSNTALTTREAATVRRNRASSFRRSASARAARSSGS